MQKNKKIVTIIVAIILLSLLFSVGINAEEFPDGATVYFYDVHGTDKEIITELVDNDSGTLLKTMDMFGPAGDYFVQGIRMWGYDVVDSDFPWHLMVSAELTSMSGSTSSDGGRSYYTQIGAEFTKLLSPDTYEATVYYDPHTCVANVKHITVDQNGNESLYSSSTLNLTYDSYFSTSKRYISNHTLNAEYSATVSGTFEWSMLDSTPNLPEDSYTSRYHSPTWEDIEESYHDEREIDIIFKYTLNHYSIEYDANGGENAPDSQTKWYGIDLALSEDIPTRDGYTFLGWHTSATATYALYEAGETYAANSAKRFYAVWKENEPEVVPEAYTVTYDANGGSGAPSAQSKTEGVDLMLSYLEPSRSGYTFLGWSRYSWSSTIYYEPGDTYSNDADITLYAVWEEVPAEPTLETYIVSYDANGGVCAPASQIKTEDVDLTLSYQKPIYSGYIFLGWTKYSWSSIVYYEPGDSYTDNSDIMLYAVWEEEPTLETYTISYDANGGSGAPSSQTKNEDEVLTLSSEMPSRNGYEFLGWSTSSVATTPTYYPGGSFSLNANTTLYAVWEYSPITYDVFYNANGGSGAPLVQIKTHDVDLTLSTIEPTRDGYTFKGWDADSNATSATYWPGNSYTDNSSITLYAVWEKDNYEFSISNLTLSASEINKNELLDIEVRTDSWDKNNAYSDIPVQLYIDGFLVSTEYVDFEAYGIAYITFNIDVGEEEGEHEVEVRVNWNKRSQESDPSNNSVSGSYTIREDSYELGVDFANPNADYIAGTTVITSFTISNDSEADVIPAMECMANFSAYYYNGSSKMEINNQDWTNIVIPKGGTNLIYFKWTVPETLVGKTVYCECVINSDSKLNENNRDNNTITLTKTVGEKPVSQTPNTRYEGNKPSNYSKVSAPTEVAGSASWTVWEYTNGAFVQRKYGVRVSADNPQTSPSVNCETAEYIDGEWTMKSGYGVQLEYTPTITTLAGCLTPSSDAYTAVQAVCATFPENKYLAASTQCRTLIYTDSAWCFEENDYADNNERVHFIPIWFDDGDYIISVTITEVWTPAGMITAVRNAKAINVDGTIYDDWYQG